MDLARQAPLSMGLSRQGYWSGLSFPSPGDLPNTGIKPRSPALQADALSSELTREAPSDALGPPKASIKTCPLTPKTHLRERSSLFQQSGGPYSPERLRAFEQQSPPPALNLKTPV